MYTVHTDLVHKVLPKPMWKAEHGNIHLFVIIEAVEVAQVAGTLQCPPGGHRLSSQQGQMETNFFKINLPRLLDWPSLKWVPQKLWESQLVWYCPHHTGVISISICLQKYAIFPVHLKWFYFLYLHRTDTQAAWFKTY